MPAPLPNSLGDLTRWDERSEVMHEVLRAWPEIESRALWRFLIGAARAVGAERIVEIGCRHGHHVEEDPVEYTGVDYGYFVEFARERHPNRSWVKADFDRLDDVGFAPIAGPSTLYVVRGRLEHVRAPEALLRALARLLDESAILLIAHDASQPPVPLPALSRRRLRSSALIAAADELGLSGAEIGTIASPEAGGPELAVLAVGQAARLAAVEVPLTWALRAAGGPSTPVPPPEDGAAQSEPDAMLFTPEMPLLSRRAVYADPSARSIEAPKVAELILAAREERRPFSILRLGNGEGRVLGFPDFVSPNWLSRSFRNWFRSRAPELSLEALQEEAAQVVREADVIGVHRKRYLDPQYFLPLRLLDLYGLAGTDTPLAPADVHLHLLSLDFYRELLRGERGISIVCGHDLARQVAAEFSVPDVRLFKVPAQAKFFFDAEDEPHFPTVFDRLRGEIDVRWPGELFLVGAGYLGKIYCGWIKQRGGIAVDIGSVFDLWAGEHTRGSDTSIAARHRLGA